MTEIATLTLDLLLGKSLEQAGAHTARRHDVYMLQPLELLTGVLSV